MATLAPRIDFARLSDEGIANYGLEAAQDAFLRDVAEGLTNGDSLALVVGAVDDDEWVELGNRLFGPAGLEFVANIDPDEGKLATALRYEMDSIEANQLRGDSIPEGPQRYTGAVFHVARAHTAENGWMTRIFAGAASGVQGHVDMATTYTALTRMGALWALKMQTLHGKP